MIATATLIICSLTLITIAVYPLYSALMARIMDRQLAEKEPKQSEFGRQTEIVRLDHDDEKTELMAVNDRMVCHIRVLNKWLQWSIDQAEILLEAPNGELDAATDVLQMSFKEYGE